MPSLLKAFETKAIMTATTSHTVLRKRYLNRTNKIFREVSRSVCDVAYSLIVLQLQLTAQEHGAEVICMIGGQTERGDATYPFQVFQTPAVEDALEKHLGANPMAIQPIMIGSQL